MTGRIDRYYSATSTDPLLRVSANNKDCYLFEIGHGTSAGTVSGNSYVLEYHGTGSSPENTLRLLTRASNAYAEAVKVNENGIVTFAKQIVGIIDTAAATEHDLKFSDVKTAGAAAPAAGSYVTFNGEENITISTQTIGALNLNGDTMLGRLTTEKPINQILVGTGTAASAGASGAADRYKPAKWTFNTGMAPVDGDIITIKIPVAGHSYGVYISIDNGTTYHPAVCNGTGRLTTHYPVGNYITLVFEAAGSAASMYPLNGGTATQTVTGGAWRVINYYDTNSTYNLCQNLWYNNTLAKAAIVKNTIIVGDENGYQQLTGQITFDVRYPILYTTAAIASGAAPYQNLFTSNYDVNLATTVTGFSGTKNQIVYLVGTLSGTTFSVDPDILTTTIPTTENGKTYIPLGKLGNNSTGANYFFFKPGIQPQMYAYISGAFRPIGSYGIYLPLTGGTMNGTIYLANGTTYYINNSAQAKFDTITTTGAVTLGSTLAVTGATTLSGTVAITNTATTQTIQPSSSDTYSLGTSSARWSALYLGTADSYGSDTQPIWWSAGKPATCTSYANAAVKSAGEFTSAKSVTLTGDTTGSASSKAGWSITTTTYKVSAQADSTTWRAQNDGPYADLYKRHIVFDGLKNNANIGAPTTDVTYSHVITISGWTDWSGGPTSQLAFHTNGISTRNAKNANEWNDWMNVVRADKTGAGASTTPVWIDSTGKAVPCAQVDVPTMWRKDFSISLTAATTTVDSVIQNSTFTEDMQVIQVVITAGGERLTSPITWSFVPYPNSTDRVDLHLQFTCETADAATTLAGYVFIARVVTL